jgi:uncharacterized RDD family membrane protein YckC
VTTTAAHAPVDARNDDELAELLQRIEEAGELDGDLTAPAVGAALTRPTEVVRPDRTPAAVIEPEGGLSFDPEFASFGARAVGTVIDLVVLVALMVPGAALAATGNAGLVALGVGVAMAGFVAATVLYARGVSRGGQSLGNKIARTKVVDARNGHFVGAGEAGLRFVLRFVVSIILLIGFVVALWDSQRRTFHDKIAGTVVTRPPRESWSIEDEVRTGGTA